MSKRQKDMKSKLMAAICMLLVSSIMMVSTTYAWFTLSTAPEVTGITTAVGANGNLEMALLPTNQDLTKLDDATNGIKSGTGTSMSTVNKSVANVTWGNLVDLSDNATYGLDLITLNPAKLNETDGVVGANPLFYPVYGADGRVTELSDKVNTGVYAKDAFYSPEAGVTSYGVRAVGTSSSMDARYLAYRSALQSAVNYGNKAKTAAGKSLSDNTDTLANIAIAKINGNHTYTYAEVVALQKAAQGLRDAVTSIEQAMRNYLVVYKIADKDADYEAVRTAIMDPDKSLSDLKTEATYWNDSFNPAYEKLYGTDGSSGTAKTIDDAVTQIATELEGKSESSSFDETKVDGILKSLVDTDKMTLGGKTASQFKGENGELDVDAVSDVFGSLTTCLQIVAPSDSGAYADIADFVGDYSISTTVSKVSISAGGSSFNLKNVQAEIHAKCAEGENVPYLSELNEGKGTFQTSDSAEVTSAITDYYGYIIDLAFRTNAANSHLQLQTEAANRIYSDSTNSEIMGNGSSMTFTSQDTNFGADKVSALMNHLRIVFFETSTGTILGEARLDTANGEPSESTVTAPLKMWNSGESAFASSAAITALNQNEAKAVSVLVYLDGESITNADVANAYASMTGTMNLQFSSDADLVPMEYSDLKQGTATTSGTTYTLLDTKNVTLHSTATNAGFTRVTYAAGITKKATTGGENDTFGVAVSLAGNATIEEGTNVYLKVGAGDWKVATLGNYSGMSGYGITVDSAVSSDATISVAVGTTVPMDTTATPSPDVDGE